MNNILIYNDLAKDCLSDLWTLYLTFIGILLSLFTLLYSFILSKRDELKIIAEQIKLGDKSPLIIQKRKFAIAYIKRLVNINKQCFCILLISIVLVSCSWIGMRLLNDGMRFWALVIILIITLFVVGYIIYLAIKIRKQYYHDIKI